MEKIVIIEEYKPLDDGMSYEQRANRESVKRELVDSEIEPFSFEVYEKTQEDINSLKVMKSAWRRNMKLHTKDFTKRKHEWSHTVSLERFKELLKNAA